MTKHSPPASHLTLRRRLALEAWRMQYAMRVREHPLRQLFWESTHRCNVSCLHCGSDCTAGTGDPDMPAEDFLRVLDSITPHVDPHRVMVIISGGEPLVRADLEDVGREIYRREYPWGIVTNGYALTAGRLDRLRRAGLRAAAVSLDGLEEEHDWLRGRKGSHLRAVAALSLLSRCGDVEYDAITCVNSRNISYLPEIERLILSTGTRAWRLFTIFPSGRAAGREDLSLTTEQYRYLLDFIRDRRQRGEMFVQYCCEGFLGSYEGEVRDGFYHCEAGVSVASVLIDGSISGCASIRSDYHQGNIYRDDFWDVWENRFGQYRDRQWMHTGECAECKMWRYCQGNGMHLRRSDGTLARCNLRELG
ncbi:MAG TPA: radical SAM/SPASM domain-containing protein [Porphyromonadaceae bacterium]|nr:radical SAM/SPASM domain-containing protein [Porphyromonadaceae bacterium]